MWVAYWDANVRLSTLQQPDLDAFYSRWSGTYVEDRLRNDWLLELDGKQLLMLMLSMLISKRLMTRSNS